MGRLPSPVEKLTSGIRQRQVRGVEQALREGASPDSCVPLSPEEQFGTPRAPVLYLAVHHDFPEAIRLLIGHGAKLQNDTSTGLTPRTHAAWKFRWACLDAFDESPAKAQDDDMVLSAIVAHWAQPLAGHGLEQVFFHRMDRTSMGFSLTPDLTMSFLVGVLFGWEGYRVSQMQRLVAHALFQSACPNLAPALRQNPDRFMPHYAKMHQQAQRFLGERELPEQALETMAALNIPLALPAMGAMDPKASAWLEQQQARVDALACRATLEENTAAAESQSDTRQRGRL